MDNNKIQEQSTPINHNEIVQSELEQKLNQYSFDTVFAGKGEEHIDFIKASSRGLTMLDVEALSEKSGLPIRVSKSADTYKDMFPNLKEEELGQVYESGLDAFTKFKDGQYSKLASNIGIAPDNLLFKHLGLSNTYSSNKVFEGSALGHKDIDGFTQLITEEEYANRVGLAYDPSKDVWMNIGSAKDNKALVIKEGRNPGDPEYHFEARDWSEDLSQESILSVFGTSSEMKSNVIASFGKGVWESTIPALGQALAWTIDKPADVYEWISTGEITGNKATDRISNQFGNISGALTHRNTDEIQGAFDNWQSFFLNLGTVVGQLATMRGVSGAAFHSLKGLSPLLAQKTASIAGMGQMAAYMSYSMDQELGAMGWSEEMRTTFSMATFPIVFLSENLIGANNVTKFLRNDASKVQKAFVASMPKIQKAAKGAKPPIGSDTAKQTFLGKIATGANDFAKKMAQYADEGSIPASMLTQALEEMPEEISEQTMEIALKTIGDHWLKHTANKLRDYYSGAIFDDEGHKIFFLDGRIEDLDEDEYLAAKKDFAEANGILDNKDKLFDYTIAEWFNESVQAGAMGFIGGSVGGAMFHRTGAKANNEKKALLQKLAIEVASDPKYMSVVNHSVDQMVNRGVMGRTDLDEDGVSIAKSGKPSQASNNARLMLEELQINVNLAKEFDITNPVILQINGGEKNLLNELFSLNKKKRALETDLKNLESSNLDADAKAKKQGELEAMLEANANEIARYNAPEGNGKFSQAHNDRTKEMVGSFKFAQKHVMESFNAGLNAEIDKAQQGFNADETSIKNLAKEIANLKKTPIDKLTKKIRDDIKKGEKDLAKMSKELGKKKVAIDELVASKGTEFENYQTKEKDKYWSDLLKASLIDFHYKDYRSFVEGTGTDDSLDGIINQINAERQATKDAKDSQSNLMGEQLDKLVNIKTRLEGLEAWKTGKDIHNSAEFKAIANELTSTLDALNSINKEYGFTETLKNLKNTLASFYGDSFFSKIDQVIGKSKSDEIIELNGMKEFDLDVSPATTLGDYKDMQTRKSANDKIKEESNRIGELLDSGTLSEEESASASQQFSELTEQYDPALDEFDAHTAKDRTKLYEEFGEDGDQIGSILEKAAIDATEKSKFAKEHLGWVETGKGVIDEAFTSIDNQADADQELLSRDNLTADDWTQIYLNDITRKSQKLNEDKDTTANAENAVKDIEQLIANIRVRQGNLLFQSAFDEMENSNNHKGHLTENVDYALPYKEAALAHYQLELLAKDLEKIKKSYEALSGSRSMRQVKSNAKNLEFQRLSLFHILTETGDLLGSEFKALVEDIGAIDFDGKTVKDIDDSIAKNESKILKARQIVFNNRMKLLQSGNFDKLFYNNSGTFHFLGGREQTFRILEDQLGVDYLNDDFVPGKTITSQKNALDKTSYMVFLTFLEETLSVDPFRLYEVEKDMLKSQFKSDSKVASPEQIMSIRQTVAFMNKGNAEVMKALSDLIIKHDKSDGKQSTIKSISGILFNAMFMRGAPGVGKTNVMLPIAIRMHMEMNNIKKLKLKIVDSTGQLEQRLKELNKEVGFSGKIEIEVLDQRQAVTNGFGEDYDMLIWDEASLLKEKHLDRVKEYGKKKPIIFLGDEAQMQSINESSVMSPASRRMYRTTPVSTSYRSSVFQIDDLSQAFRHKIVKFDADIDFPVVWAEAIDGKMVGARYKASESSLIQEYIDSKSTSKALIFLRFEDVKNFYDAIQSKSKKDVWDDVKDGIYILETDLDIKTELEIGGVKIRSVQGHSVDEAYVNISFKNLNGIGNLSLPGRAGLTAVSRGRNYVALIGSEGLNASSKNDVIWNENPFEAETKEQLVDKRNTLNLERTKRFDELNNALQGNEKSGTDPEPQPTGKDISAKDMTAVNSIARKKSGDVTDDSNILTKEEAALFNSNPKYKYLVWRAMKEMAKTDGINNADQASILFSSIANDIDKWIAALAKHINSNPNTPLNANQLNLYNDFKNEVDAQLAKLREGTKPPSDPEVPIYHNAIDDVLVKSHDGKPTTIRLEVGTALVSPDGELEIVLDLFTEKGETYVAFSGDKRFSRISILSDYKLLAPVIESSLNGKMHNMSALNFQNDKALYTSTATIPEVAGVNFSQEDIEAIRGVKTYFLSKFSGKRKLVYYPSASLWKDSSSGIAKFANVFLVIADEKSVSDFIDKNQSPQLAELAKKFDRSTLVSALSVVGSMGEVEVDYFTKAVIPTDPKSEHFDAIQREIDSGFNSTNPEDKFRAENIKLNTARLAMLRDAVSKKNGTDPVDLGFVSLKDDLTINNRVVYDYKSNGKPFSKFVEENNAKGIRFFTQNAYSKQFQKANGETYWAYVVPWQRGNDTTTHDLVVTMPNLEMIRNQMLGWEHASKQFAETLSDLKKMKGDGEFYPTLNRSILGRMLSNSKSTLTEMIGKKSIVHEFLQQRDGEIELIGENDAEKLVSAEGFIDALNAYFSGNQAFQAMGKVYLPFDGNSPLLQTKAKMIAQPQQFHEVDPTLLETPPENSNAGRGAFARVEDTRASTDPYISQAQATEIIRNILGDSFIEASLEFSNDLGSHEQLKILGLMANGKIKMLLEQNGVRSRTPKHEAFHVVFNFMASQDVKDSILEYGRLRKAYELGVESEKVTDVQAEEWLADEYAYRNDFSTAGPKNNLWNRFLNWVSKIAHSVGLYKNELDYLYWQMDKGMFRDAPIMNADNITRYSLEQDASESDSDGKTKKKYDSSMLLSVFGDMKSVERISFAFAQEIYRRSPLSGYGKSADFADALRVFEKDVTNENFQKSNDGTKVLTSTGKEIFETTPSEVKQIMNDNNDSWDYFDYVMQNKDIRDAMIEKTFPGIDVETLDYHHAGEDTIGEDKSLDDFRKKTNDFIRLAVRTTPFFSFSLNEAGRITKGEASGFVDFEDLQSALMLAGIELRKNGNNFRELGTKAFVDTLIAAAHKNGIDSRRGRNILSFVNRLTSFDPNESGILDLLQKSNDPKQVKFMNEFVNGLLSTYQSLYQKEIVDFSVQGYNKDHLRIKKLVFEGGNENKFKTRLKNNIKSFVMHDHSQVKERAHKNLNSEFGISESGIMLPDGTSLIKLENGRYVFNDHKDLASSVKRLMSHMGMSILSKRGLTLMLRENDANLSKHKSTFKHISDRITELNDNSVGAMTPREFLADNLIKMALSVNHNKSFFENVEKLRKTKAEGVELTNGELHTLFTNSDHHKILEKSLRNVDNAIDPDDVGEDGFNYKVFKPTDFYKFFQLMGEVKAQTTTYGGLNFFYRPDGKKEYLFGLSSNFFERFADGLNKNRIILSNNGIVSKNLLLAPNSPYDVSNIEEIKGIKQSDINKGVVNPNTSDLLTVGINLFLDSHTSGETKMQMAFMNTNISDSGYMYATTYKVSRANALFLKGGHGKDFTKSTVNNEAINNALKSVYDRIIEEHDKSINRWKVVFGQAENTTGELLPTAEFLAIDQGNKTRINEKEPILKELNRINDVLRGYEGDSAAMLLDAIMKSDLVLNRDYVISDGKVQFGKATSGNIDLANGNKPYSIYNIVDATNFSNFNNAGDQKALTDFRRDVFGREYFNFIAKMNKYGAKTSKDYTMPGKQGIGNFGDGLAHGQTKGGDWNPVMEAYFMGYHIMNTSFNEMWQGSHFQYGGFSTSDMGKRAKPFTTPGITPGRIDTMTDPDGMGEKAHVVVVTDQFLKSNEFDMEIYNQMIEATDGVGWANPLFYRFMDHSFGGRFSTMDKGMRKPITSYNNAATGLSIQMKQSEHVVSYDTYSNSLIAERMFHEQLRITDPKLLEAFVQAFESNGGHTSGHVAWENALDAAVEFVKDNNLHNKLVWQFIHPSAVKTGIHRVNNYSFDEGFSDPTNIPTVEIDTHEIRMVLNPYQDFNDNERMAPPTQMLAIMGIGTQNSQRVKAVNDNLSKIFDVAFRGAMNQLEKNPDGYINNLLKRAVEAMPTFGNFAEMINNPRISLNLPQLAEKAQQIISNEITKQGAKRKYAGLRANQAPGSILDVYEKDGKIYMLNDIRKAGGVTNVDGISTVDASYTKRKLKPMTNKHAAEVIVPFSYMQKFGVKPTDSLRDIYKINLSTAVDGKTSYDFNVNGEVDTKALKKFISEHYDSIDLENTPLMRAMNRVAEIGKDWTAEKDLDAGTIGAQIGNLQDLKKLRDTMAESVDHKGELLNNLDRIDNYFNALDESLNIFSVRIPTSNLGSGMRGRVVGFVNDMGNTVYTSELKSILDGSDYDIDQLSIFMKFINNDFTMPDADSLKGMQNQIVEALQDVYKTESGNDGAIYNMLSLKSLSDLADKFEQKAEKIANDPGTNADDYKESMQGSESIDRFANLSSVYAYISQLPIEQTAKLIPWVSDAIKQQGTGEGSIIHQMGLLLNSSTDNNKVLINGRIGITKDATNVVGAMILTGHNIDQIGNFLQNPTIAKIYEMVERGEGVTESSREFDPYLQATTMLKNIAKEIGTKGDYGSTDAAQRNSQKLNENDLPGLIAQEEDLTAKRQAHVENSQYFDKRTKQLAPQFYQDPAEMGVFKQMSDEITAVATNRKYLQDQIILSQFKDFLVKGESLKRIAHMVTLRKGFKAVSSDFEFYYNTLSSYLGMDVREFAKGANWDIDSHMAHFKENNNEAAYGTKDEAETAIEFERQIVSSVNLPGIVRKLPQFDSYIKGLDKLNQYFESKFLTQNPVFKGWINDYLSGQERTTFVNKGQRSKFINELGKFFLSVHFKQNFKGVKFDLGLHNSGLRPNSILKSVDIASPEGRNLYALQFPQFIVAMKNADSMDLFKVQGGEDYSDWQPHFQTNEFLERLSLSDNNERSFLVLEDSHNLTENNVYKLRSEYEKLPLKLREMLEIYSLITNGFNAPSGSISDVMGTTILEGVSSTLDSIQQKVDSGDPVIEIWKHNFLRVLPHADEMSRYLSQKDKQKGSERETALIPKNDDSFHKDNTQVARLQSKGHYTPEYLRVGKLGIAYDPDLDMTTTFEPLLGLTSLEIDELANNGKLVKNFVRQHNYQAKYNNADNFYILPNGSYVRLDSKGSNKHTAVFVGVAPEETFGIADRTRIFANNTSLLTNADGESVYKGKLTKDLVSNNTDKLFIMEGYERMDNNNYAQRDPVRAMDNVFGFAIRKTQTGRYNLYNDVKGKPNPDFVALVEKQIREIQAMSDGKQVVFPEKGFSNMTSLEQNKAFAHGLDYMLTRLNTEFGIDFKADNRETPGMTEQEKADYLSDADFGDSFTEDGDYGYSNEPANSTDLLNQADIAAQKAEGKEGKETCIK